MAHEHEPSTGDAGALGAGGGGPGRAPLQLGVLIAEDVRLEAAHPQPRPPARPFLAAQVYLSSSDGKQ